MMYLKFEIVWRWLSLLIYIIISIAVSISLPESFCDLWTKMSGDNPSTSSTEIGCKWQMFGFRVVFMIIYLPLDFIMALVVLRHCRDLLFQINFKEKMQG